MKGLKTSVTSFITLLMKKLIDWQSSVSLMIELVIYSLQLKRSDLE